MLKGHLISASSTTDIQQSVTVRKTLLALHIQPERKKHHQESRCIFYTLTNLNSEQHMKSFYFDSFYSNQNTNI